MEQFFNNVFIVFENAFIAVWYWANMYRWELCFLVFMTIAVYFEYKEMKVHYVDDKRKVI